MCMAQAIVDEIWNKIKNRYESGEESNCGCGMTIEEAADESDNDESNAGDR